MKARICILTLMTALLAPNAFAAQNDPSIERLLGKLPPPEKFSDPASRDPLAREVATAFKAQNFGTALEASRKLADRYPKSIGAQLQHAILAAALRHFPEASVGYHKVLRLRPDFALAYVGLGLSEASQQHFAVAFSDFQQITRLVPRADMGWIGLSACAEKLGRRADSLAYSRRATSVAPASAAAWYQVAREEGLSGNKQAAAKALAKAQQLRKTAAPTRSSSRHG